MNRFWSNPGFIVPAGIVTGLIVAAPAAWVIETLAKATLIPWFRYWLG